MTVEGKGKGSAIAVIDLGGRIGRERGNLVFAESARAVAEELDHGPVVE
jgi:hypothetical protein